LLLEAVDITYFTMDKERGKRKVNHGTGDSRADTDRLQNRGRFADRGDIRF